LKPIYLTFDDGPHETFTPAILDTLATHGAHATFFQEGRHVHAHPELSKRVAQDGHAVGNHSWDHPRLDWVDRTEVRRQLRETSDAIGRASGQRPSLFRPPEGELGDEAKAQEIRHEAKALGMTTVLWDISTFDWQKPGRGAIVASVIDAARPGAVVLLHDGECADQEENVAAVDAILSDLAKRGYTFTSLSAAAH
jgi:peptidoglycan/xylan/chitin deacetylase (PgdA/CDA1 family)